MLFKKSAKVCLVTPGMEKIEEKKGRGFSVLAPETFRTLHNFQKSSFFQKPIINENISKTV